MYRLWVLIDIYFDQPSATSQSTVYQHYVLELWYVSEKWNLIQIKHQQEWGEVGGYMVLNYLFITI